MRTFFTVCVLFATLALSSEANAQFEQQRRFTSYANRGGGRSAAASILSRSTVSPYLALADLNGTGLDTSQNYFTQVRPRLESNRQQQQQQRQLIEVQRNVTQMRSNAARQSQPGARATGHPTRFQFYSNYYPSLNRR